MSECALLKAAGQTHVLQTLVESNAECEVPKAAGQAHILETLVEVVAKCELLKATGQASPDSGQITLHNTNAFQQCPCYSLPVNHEFFFSAVIRDWVSDILREMVRVKKGRGEQQPIHTHRKDAEKHTYQAQRPHTWSSCNTGASLRRPCSNRCASMVLKLPSAKMCES